jgi:hypothetical protein
VAHLFDIFGTNGSNDWYGFWSGFAADVPLIGGAYLLGRKHNCHVHGCWRVGRHPVDGTSYIVCRRHHPHGNKSARDIARESSAAVRAAGFDDL